MIYIISGEGPSDIGVRSYDGSFSAGPMTHFIDRIVEEKHQFSPLLSDAFLFFSEADVSEESKRIGSGKGEISLPGKKKKRETAYFYQNARALARLAVQKAEEYKDGDPVAILFRDSDGTVSQGRGIWKDKFDSMVAGFDAENFGRGVPMIPKPKSEVWLLCAIKNNPYQHCDNLENISGNDNSPDSAKDQLAVALGGEFSILDVNDKISCGEIDPLKIDMSSFNAFKDRLEQVIS